jgi:hypothetical protein
MIIWQSKLKYKEDSTTLYWRVVWKRGGFYPERRDPPAGWEPWDTTDKRRAWSVENIIMWIKNPTSVPEEVLNAEGT